MENFYEHLFGVRGKVALVTGGTRGIGLMIAEGLVRCGARVYVASRKEDACATTQETLGRLGDCVALPANVGTMAGCDALAEEIASREERLDLLVNNAGLTWNQPLDEFPEKGWDRVMDRVSCPASFWYFRVRHARQCKAWSAGNIGHIRKGHNAAVACMANSRRARPTGPVAALRPLEMEPTIPCGTRLATDPVGRAEVTETRGTRH